MDKNYWNDYYKKGLLPNIPSLFAQYVLERYCKPNIKLIELGCGNGRDTIFFSRNNIITTAIDQSDIAIERLRSNFNNDDRTNLIIDDFTTLKDFDIKFDIVYSRFTMHSITETQETNVLQWAFRNLISGGFLCIEARGHKNELFKKGQPTDQRNTYFFEDHSRRFINLKEFIQKMKSLDFEVIESKEEKGFSPFNDTDETFIRVVCRKP